MAVENVMVNSLEELEDEEKKALGENNDFYQGQISAVENKYDEMIAATEAAGEEAKKQQQEQSDFAIAQIEQQKEQAQKDYEKEQSAAYVDYTKQTQKHGVAAEEMAAMGMNGSGYSESSRVAMYTDYQNRVAAARASIEQAKVAYDNAITQARLANDATIAEIALQTLQSTMQYEMESLMQTQALQEAARAQQLSIQSAYNTQRNTLKQQNRSMLTELIKTGYTPTAEELTAAGMTQAEVDAMAGYIIGDGDGVLTEEELLNDPTRYNMDGLKALGANLTEEELEGLIGAGIVQETVDTQKGEVRFSVRSVTEAKNWLNINKSNTRITENVDGGKSGDAVGSDSANVENMSASELIKVREENAAKKREEAEEQERQAEIQRAKEEIKELEKIISNYEKDKEYAQEMYELACKEGRKNDAQKWRRNLENGNKELERLQNRLKELQKNAGIDM